MTFKPIDELTFCDDYMFGAVMRNPEICKSILETLLNIQIEKLEYPELQKSISTYYESKGVRLDVYVKDSDKVFDIELQNALDDDLPLRTRFYQSMIDTDNLLKGQDYSELPTNFVIFICKYDPIGKNLPIYTFENRCLENLEISLNDKCIKKIYNANAYNQEKDLAISAFLEYVCNQKAVDDFTSKITSIVERIKTQEVNRKEYNSMNLHDRDNFRRGKKEGITEGIQQGISQGEYKKAIETAKNMLLASLGSLEQIAQITNLPLETVKDLAKK